jgi:hypothetical protein
LAGFEGVGGVTGAAADFVEADVAGDGVNPGGKAGGNLVARGGLEDAEEDRLGHVFGLGEVVQHAEHEVDEGLFVFLDQLLKSGHVPGFDEEHQFCIWVGRFEHSTKVNATPGFGQGCGRGAI